MFGVAKRSTHWSRQIQKVSMEQYGTSRRLQLFRRKRPLRTSYKKCESRSNHSDTQLSCRVHLK